MSILTRRLTKTEAVAVVVLLFVGLAICGRGRSKPVTTATATSGPQPTPASQSVQAHPADEELWVIGKRYLTGNCWDKTSGTFLTPDSQSGHHQVTPGGHTLEDGRKVYHYKVKGWFDTNVKGKTVRAHFGINLLAARARASDRDVPSFNTWVSNGWSYSVLTTLNRADQSKCVAQYGRLTEEYNLDGFTIDVPINPEALLPPVPR